MQSATLGREVVLIFDEYNGGGVRIKRQGILLIGGGPSAAVPTVGVRPAAATAEDKGPSPPAAESGAGPCPVPGARQLFVPAA